jgi:SsrA-binding protein
MLLAKNRKATFEYEILEKFTAGIVLNGHEVKAVREGTVSFEGAFVKLLSGRPCVVNMHIGKYSKQSQEIDKTDTTRSRQLLMNKIEIRKLQQELAQKGKSAIPLALILRNNLVKLELAIVKGRKKHEKKVVAKEKQIKKDLETFSKDIRQTKGMTWI